MNNYRPLDSPNVYWKNGRLFAKSSSFYTYEPSLEDTARRMFNLNQPSYEPSLEDTARKMFNLNQYGYNPACFDDGPNIGPEPNFGPGL